MDTIGRSRSPQCYRYAIRVVSHLDPAWSPRLGDLTITHDPGGTTTLVGPLVDQAALYGLLSRLRDLGLTLLTLERLAAEGDEPERSPYPAGTDRRSRTGDQP